MTLVDKCCRDGRVVVMMELPHESSDILPPTIARYRTWHNPTVCRFADSKTDSNQFPARLEE